MYPVKILTAILVITLTGCCTINSPKRVEYFFASQPGQPTLDEGEGGGNPFASAFIELLKQQKLDIEAFRTKIVALTSQKSQGFQRPELIFYPTSNWQIIPIDTAEKRIALVLVYSDYTKAAAQSLAGAKTDLFRIAQALQNTGFQVQTVIDPDNDTLHQVMESFSTRSQQADVALLYTTGHGVEVDGVTYLLPGDYPVNEGNRALEENGINLEKLASILQSRQRNLLFYGACRNNPFSTQKEDK